MGDNLDTYNGKFDDVFMGMLQHCGKIEPFLDAIFNFLARRTDFFHLMHGRNDKLGFPPGFAEKMLIKIFEKYQGKVLKNDPIYMKWKENQNSKVEAEKPSKMYDEEGVKAEIVQKYKDGSEKQSPNNDIDQSSQSLSNSEVDHNLIAVNTEGSNTSSGTNNACSGASGFKDTEALITADCFNGGKTEKYSWSQSISDIDIKVPVPPFLKNSKDLSVEIRSNSLKIYLKNEPPPDCGLTGKSILVGNLEKRIRCDESLWSLMPGDCISLNLEKFEQTWWEGLLEGDEKIDKTKIDTTQHIHDFDNQTQSDIRKVMYDNQQKMMGKPTSDEMKTHTLLEKAWDAEGSPFKGTPFDPSKVNIGGL